MAKTQGAFGTVELRNGAHHLRLYSSVNVNANGALILDDGAGKPKRDERGRLVVGKGERLLNSQGTPVRLQQSITLCRQDEAHKFSNSPAVNRLADAKREEIEAWERAVGNGEEPRPDGDITVAEFFYRIYLPQMQLEKTTSTIKSYKGYWDAYLAPHFNETKTLRNYEAYTATNFLEKLATKYSKNTVMHVRAIASAIFAYAISKGYLKAAAGETKNPWRDARRNIKCQDVEKTKSYTQPEIERILDALEHVSGREEHSARVAGMVISACFYGALRPSEAAGLDWSNVDLNAGTITVCQAFVAGQLKKTTKTDEARTITMLPQLRSRFKIWQGAYPTPPTSGFVFPNRDGDGPININHLSSRVIAETCEKGGLDWWGLYACRRGWGTEAYNHGVPVEDIAAFMGNSPAVAFRNYVKDKSRAAARATSKLAIAFAGFENQKVLSAGTQ